MNWPSEVNFSIRSCAESTTYTFPAASVARPPIGPNWPWPAAVGPPLAEVLAGGVELLHDVAELIGDVHVAGGVDRDRLGKPQHGFGALADDRGGGVRAGGGRTRSGTGFGMGGRVG